MNVFELTPRRIAPFGLLCCFVCLASPSLRAQDFKFTDFSSTGTLAFNGSAGATTNGSGAHVLRITPASAFQVGSAWYCGSDCSFGTGKLFVAQGFSTTFKFQISGSASIADGFAFVIQNGCFSNETCNIDAVAPNPAGAGGDLGYTGLTNSLAIELDTFCNTGLADACGVFNGFSTANEVGIQSCGTSANTANHSSCNLGRKDLSALFFFDGGQASTTAGSTTVTLTGTSYSAAQMQNMVGLSFVISTAVPDGAGHIGTGTNFGLIAAASATTQTLTLATPASTSYAATVNYAIEPVLADGNVHTVTITYTPPTSCGEVCINPNLTVSLDNNVVLTIGIDIVGSVLAGTDGALVGFTSATGTFDDNHDILAWSFDTAQTQPAVSGTSHTYFYDGGNDSWTLVYPPGLPAGATLTAWRTELTQAEWAQRVQGTSYQGTTLAPVNAPGFISPGDGVVWSAFLSVNGVEYNPNPSVPYTITATWNSSDPNYLTESGGFLKAHPIASDNWQDILLTSGIVNIDPTYVHGGGSATPCSDYANVAGVTGTPPAVTITLPADGATYTPNEIVDASFSCSGNFVTGCVGAQDPNTVNAPVNLFAPVDTSAAGTTHTFSVVADVSSGPSGTASATYNVSSGKYGVQLLYASNRAVKSGADFPIRMYLTNPSGMDVSSSTIIVHALKVILVSTSTSGDVTETGSSNPDFDFRFDSTQGPSGGYDFNLKTTGLGTGKYLLQFQVSGDTPGATYTVPFRVK